MGCDLFLYRMFALHQLLFVSLAEFFLTEKGFSFVTLKYSPPCVRTCVFRHTG